MNREFGAAVMDRRPRALRMTNIMIMATILGFWLFAIASRAPTEIAIVNKDGKRVLALDYEAASYFAEGLASVKRGGKDVLWIHRQSRQICDQTSIGSR